MGGAVGQAGVVFGVWAEVEFSVVLSFFTVVGFDLFDPGLVALGDRGVDSLLVVHGHSSKAGLAELAELVVRGMSVVVSHPSA